MDYEAAMKALSWPTCRPGHNMVTDADLIMARAWLESITPHTVTEAWIMGHASEKEKHDPDTITDLKRDNSKGNVDAEWCIQQGGHPSTFIPCLLAFNLSWN